MFDKLLGKSIKCVYVDGNQHKAISGLLKDQSPSFVTIFTNQGQYFYVKVQAITSLYEKISVFGGKQNGGVIRK